MTTPADLLNDLMARVRRDLYAGRPDTAWFKQQETVRQALTLLARDLDRDQVPLPLARYRAIYDQIITGIVQHGHLAQVKYPCAYLLHVVQKHLQHHGDTYYEEGKSLRNSLDLVVHRAAAKAARRAAAPDPTVEVLAQVHAAITTRRRRPKPPAPTLQPDLFGAAKCRETLVNSLPPWDARS